MHEKGKSKAGRGTDIYTIREVVKIFNIDSCNDGCCTLSI